MTSCCRFDECVVTGKGDLPARRHAQESRPIFQKDAACQPPTRPSRASKLYLAAQEPLLRALLEFCRRRRIRLPRGIAADATLGLRSTRAKRETGGPGVHAISRTERAVMTQPLVARRFRLLRVSEEEQVKAAAARRESVMRSAFQAAGLRGRRAAVLALGNRRGEL